MTTRAQVEDAVLALLAPLTIPGGGYVQVLKPFAGDLSPARDDEYFQRVTQGALPAVLVSTGDGEYERRTMGRVTDLDFDVQLLIGASNLRSPEHTHRGDLGLYKLIEDIRGRLFRRPLGVAGVRALYPTGERAVLRSPDRSIWLLTYSCLEHVSEAPLADEADDYTSIHNELNFPAGDPGEPANPAVEFDHDVTP